MARVIIKRNHIRELDLFLYFLRFKHQQNQHNYGFKDNLWYQAGNSLDVHYHTNGDWMALSL